MRFWVFFGVGAALCAVPPLGLVLLAMVLGTPRWRGEVSSAAEPRLRAIRAAHKRMRETGRYTPAPEVWARAESYFPGSAFLHPDVDASSRSE